MVRAAEQVHCGHRERQAEHEQQDADGGGEPQRLRGHRAGHLLAPRAVVARNLRGGAVRQEVEDREGAGEHGAGERERRELRGAEVTDDCRVNQDVERLRGECAECRQGEFQDLPVVLGSAQHGPPL